MAWALLPLLFLSFILGFTAIERDFATRPQPAVPSKVNSAASLAFEFMTYRNAVMNYVQQQLIQNKNSNVGGEVLLGTLVQYGYLSQAESETIPVGSEAVVAENTSSSITGIYGVATTSNDPGFVVCVWMPVPAGLSDQVINHLVDWYHGDLTLGRVVDNNSNWQQAGQGGLTQQVPAVCLLYASNDGKLPPPMPSAGDIISVVGLGGS